MSMVQTKPATETLEVKFERLAAVWQAATAHHSSTSKREKHPSYKEIIALGPPVVPLLLRDLDANHRQWFAALATITGANPVAAQDAGKTVKMIESWLTWGKEQGYRW